MLYEWWKGGPVPDWHNCSAPGSPLDPVLWQSSGLENWLFRAHIPRMATIVRCNCGAEYKRTEDKFLAPHTGGAVCTVCGAALEAWWESIHVPSFELIKHPDREPDPKTP